MMRAAAPCYFHPAEHPEGWEWLRTSDLDWIVVNVHNGPGEDGDPYYTPVLKSWNGPRLCGYVNTDYGARDPLEVISDAAGWLNVYSISALMLDCFPVDDEPSTGLQLIEELRAQGHDFIVANAGRPSPNELLAAADVTCVTELSWSDYQDQQFVEAAASTWHLIHSVPSSELSDARDLMARNGATYGWATPGTLPHPWGWHDSVRSNW